MNENFNERKKIWTDFFIGKRDEHVEIINEIEKCKNDHELIFTLSICLGRMQERLKHEDIRMRELIEKFK